MPKLSAVSSEFLFEGACCALCQCGHLLADAVSLFESGRSATAVALAAFAREELGRSAILEGFVNELEAGKCVTLKQVSKACEDHISKQKYAVASVVIRGRAGDRVHDIVTAKMQSEPTSPEYQRASQALVEIGDTQRKHAPTQRHAQRLRSLYVEPNENGTSWNKPWVIATEDAANFLQDAVNDYAGTRDRFLREYAGRLDSSFVLPSPRRLG